MGASNGYYTAWMIYLLAVIGAQVLLWWMLRRFKFVDLKVFLQILLFSILITPSLLDENQPYWVPAFMAAFLGGLDTGFETAIPRLWSIVAVFITLITGSLLIRLYRKKKLAFASADSQN